MRRLSTIFLLALLASSTAWGHMPSISPGGFGTPEGAYVVDDIELSQVVYHEATCDNRQLWFRVPATGSESLYIQLGVPVLDRLSNRPVSVALLGEGLEPVALPFNAPAKTGRVWTVDAAGAGEPFHEPFTDTNSWITVEETVKLSASGDYWLVAWFPDDMSGKLWLSVGTVEKFDAQAMIKVIPLLDKVREFHETLPEQANSQPSEVKCETPVVDDKEAVEPVKPSGQEPAAQEPSPQVASTPVDGCTASAAPSSPGAALALTLLALGLLVSRRRRAAA